MVRNLFGVLFILFLLSSCVTTRHGSHPGVGRIKNYQFTHPDVPGAFDGFRIAFVSDFHYKSRFTKKRLTRLVATLSGLSPDLLLMGGDYHEGCEYVPGLFAALSLVDPPYGTVGILGNHDYYRCYELVKEEMEQYGMKLLEHQVDTIRKNEEFILIAGVRNPFNLRENGISPTTELQDSDFVILLTHTPDYAQDIPIPHTDLALGGHTHGGQVKLIGLYAPVTNSKYGHRFLSGMNYTSEGVPVITTNGLGTSRRNIRAFAPSEVVMITLKRGS